MRKMKKIVSLVLAFVMVGAMVSGYGSNVKAADQRSTNVSSFAAFNNSGPGFIEFGLADGDWQTAESLTAPGVTWMENNYLYNVVFYQGDSDTEGTSLVDAMTGELYYNMFGRGNSLAMGLKADIYANITKVYIPAGTVFPSYQATGGSTPFNGVEGDDVAADTSVGSYVTTEDVWFTGQSSQVAGEWKNWTLAKKTVVDNVTINIESDTIKRLTFEIAGDTDNDAIPSWSYIGSNLHNEYNTKEYVKLYLKGQSEPKNLADYFKSTDGNLYFNLYSAGSMTFPILDDFPAATEVEKIVVKAGCQFPAVSYTGANIGSGGTLSATTATKTAYVVEKDMTFLLPEDATANMASFVYEDTSVAASTQVLGVKTGHSNNNVTFTLSATDYAGCETNRPSAKYADYNFMDMIQIYGGDSVQTLREAYPAGDEMYYNLWGTADSFTIALGSSYNTVTQIVIPAGTIFPSAAYTGYGAWDATSIPDNMVREKGGFKTTETVVYQKPEEHGEWTVATGQESEVKVTNIHVRTGTHTELLLFLSETDYGADSNYTANINKVNEYDLVENISVETTTGKAYPLAEIFDNAATYNIWGEANSIALQLKEGLDPISKVIVAKGCEFPTKAYTEGASAVKKSYVTTIETMFVANTTPSDNVATIGWTRSEVFETEEIDTRVQNIHLRVGKVLFFLSEHDYANAGATVGVGTNFNHYNFADKVRLYKIDGTSAMLSEVMSNENPYYNLWGEAGCFAVNLASGWDGTNVEKIVILEGCEFPSYTYTNGTPEKRTSYVTDVEDTYITTNLVAENADWHRETRWNLVNGDYTIDVADSVTIGDVTYVKGDTFGNVGKYAMYYTIGEKSYMDYLVIYRTGDANDNKEVNLKDLMAMKKAIAGLKILTETGSLSADTNADGSINAVDVDWLKAHLISEPAI